MRLGFRSRSSRPLGSLARTATVGFLASAFLLLATNHLAAGPAFFLDPAEDNQPSSVNTIFDERDPALSRDGRLLLFASDRGGGFRIYGAYLNQPVPGPQEPNQPLQWLHWPKSGRNLPEVPWLGGPGNHRSPCLCETADPVDGRYSFRLFFRSESDWGAGIYQADVQSTSIPGAGDQEGRLLLNSSAVKPLIQGIGLRLDGPWWLDRGSGSGILLIRTPDGFQGWSVQNCQPQPMDGKALVLTLPGLSPLQDAAGLAWESGDRWLFSRSGARNRLDFLWKGEGPELSRSLSGNTVNTDGWDELEAVFGPVRDGHRLMIFSREGHPTRRDANLWGTWLPLSAPTLAAPTPVP